MIQMDKETLKKSLKRPKAAVFVTIGDPRTLGCRTVAAVV